MLHLHVYTAPFIIQNSVSNFNWSQAQRGLSGKITVRRSISIRRDEKLLVLVGCKMHWLIGGSSSAWLASISKTVSNLEDVTALCRDQVSHSLTIMISRNTWIVPQPVVSNHHLFFSRVKFRDVIKTSKVRAGKRLRFHSHLLFISVCCQN